MNKSNDRIDPTTLLKGMDVEGLKELRKKLDGAISSYEARKRREALFAAEQAAREHGFKLADLLVGGKSAKVRRSTDSAVRYMNPKDPEQNWSGRGRRPLWVNDALAAGRTLEELAA